MKRRYSSEDSGQTSSVDGPQTAESSRIEGPPNMGPSTLGTSVGKKFSK